MVVPTRFFCYYIPWSVIVVLVTTTASSSPSLVASAAGAAPRNNRAILLENRPDTTTGRRLSRRRRRQNGRGSEYQLGFIYHQQAIDDVQQSENTECIQNNNKNKKYQAAKQLLDALGLQNACHPTRSNLVDFPQCGVEAVAVSSPSTRRDWTNNTRITKSRTLEEEKQENLADEDERLAEEEEITDDGTTTAVAYEQQQQEGQGGGWNFRFADVILAAFCVITSSIAAGLTVGLLSLDPLVLMIKARAGDGEEAGHARALLPLVRRRHLLLVTLMLLNTASSEALPVVLHDMMPELFVIIISVALILFFGEIIPSAIFIGHNQLAIASYLSTFVHGLIFLMYPIAYPIAKLLDCVVPHDGCAMTNYTRNELAALIRLQYEARRDEKYKVQTKQQQEQSPSSTTAKGEEVFPSPIATVSGVPSFPSVLIRPTFSLDLEEVMIAEGALALRSRRVADLVIPHRKVFSISYDADMTEEMIIHIFSSGYSRVPVYRGQDPKQICGILMTRQLILVKATDNKRVSDLPLHTPRCIAPNMDLVALVNLFQTGGGTIGRPTRRRAGHMAIVCAEPDLANDVFQQADNSDPPIPHDAGLIGIITMEDVLEALLQEQIYDEMDAAGRISSMHSDSISVSTAGTIHSTLRKQHRKPTTSADASYYTAML